MASPGMLRASGRVLASLLLMALLVAPPARGLPNNGSASAKDSNRPSLELSFTNKLVKSDVGAKSQESRANASTAANSTVASAARDKTPVSTGRPVIPQVKSHVPTGRSVVPQDKNLASTGRPAVPQDPITKENSTHKAPPEGPLLTSPAPNPRTTSWLPYYFSSEAIAKAFPLDPGAIREGDAAPSRGRSGSPRRIDNFPPLQNQPGEEYLDAINRRTVVPPPPVVATTPVAMTTARSTTTVAVTTVRSTTTEVAPLATAGESGHISALDFDSTTMDSEPDIGTAFSLSEDFTQGFLGFPVSETITDADLPVKLSAPPAAPSPEVPANSTSVAAPSAHPADNSLAQTTLKPSSAPPPVVTSSPLKTTTTAAPIQSSPAPESATTAVVSTGAKPETMPTKRPNLRRRLPSFRATSPRPTIRRRLPAPLTTTETVFTRPTTVAVAVEPDLPIAPEPAEDDVVAPQGTPFAPPIEPTTTRREYVMTVPPLLDFDNVARDDAAPDDEHADASLEATHLTSAGAGGIIPEGATSAIIISAIIGGCAILFFAVLMVFCMWRQHVSRRPIYPPPESSNSSSTSSTAFHSKLG